IPYNTWTRILTPYRSGDAIQERYPLHQFMAMITCVASKMANAGFPGERRSDLALCAVMLDASVLPAPISRTTSALTAAVSHRLMIPLMQLRAEVFGAALPVAIATNGALISRVTDRPEYSPNSSMLVCVTSE